jgi:hypothetical protein
MLGILLIYFIGKPFYDLAAHYDKSQWGFAILGVVAYYVGTFVMGFVLGILYPETIETMNNLLLGLIALPLGLLFSWLLYKFLENRWSTSSSNNETDSDVLDQNLNNSDH